MRFAVNERAAGGFAAGGNNVSFAVGFAGDERPGKLPAFDGADLARAMGQIVLEFTFDKSPLV